MSREASIEEKLAYLRGLKDGVTRYSWWKDGIQYVGTCGRKLQDVLREIDEEEMTHIWRQEKWRGKA